MILAHVKGEWGPVEFPTSSLPGPERQHCSLWELAKEWAFQRRCPVRLMDGRLAIREYHPR